MEPANGTAVPFPGGTVIMGTTTITNPMPSPVVAQPTIEEHHASVLHSLFAGLEKLLQIAGSPEVVAILPPKYQAYAKVIGAVDAAMTAK